MMHEDNPLYRFRFCPLCGSVRFMEWRDNARRCADCGFTYFTNPRGATVAVIVNDCGELLVARRANEPAKGMLDLPGGFVDLDEDGETAMCREIAEETGLTVMPADLRYLFSMPNRYPFSGIVCRTLDLFFECRVTGRPTATAQDDVADLRWVSLRDLRLEDFGLESVRAGLKRYLDCQ